MDIMIMKSQRIQERFNMADPTREKREKLFNLYSTHLALYTPETVAKDVFCCPLCLRSFTREALEGSDPLLSLAHITPQSLGGRLCTLACTECNNTMGKGLESELNKH